MADPFVIGGLPSDMIDGEIEGQRRVKVAINEPLIDGDKAVTVQMFTELNSRTGRQYEASFYVPALASGASADVVIVVGAEKMLIKDISVQFESDEIQTQLFRGPSYTGGTEIPVFNLNDGGAVPDDVELLAGASVTDTGTAVGPAVRSLGVAPGFILPRQTSLGQGVGVERVLADNATYLYRITNTNGATTRIAGLATWYQGPISTEIE